MSLSLTGLGQPMIGTSLGRAGLDAGACIRALELASKFKQIHL